RTTGFQRLKVTNTIPTAVTKRQKRKQTSHPPPTAMQIDSVPCCSAEARIEAKKKFWPQSFCACVNNFHRCDYLSPHVTLNGSAKSALTWRPCQYASTWRAKSGLIAHQMQIALFSIPQVNFSAGM